jgi:phage terminase Nu1 subunit (DNA packaging protein)
LIKEANMWGIFVAISRGYGNTGTTNTDFITGFISKDNADAAAEQLQKDLEGFGTYTVTTSVIRIA